MPGTVCSLPLLNSKRFPAAIAIVLAGVALNFLMHRGLPLPSISLGIYLPEIALPAAADFNRGFFMAALSLAINPAVAFAAGFILAWSIEKRWVRI